MFMQQGRKNAKIAALPSKWWNKAKQVTMFLYADIQQLRL
jgi:hypothetical protein